MIAFWLVWLICNSAGVFVIVADPPTTVPSAGLAKADVEETPIAEVTNPNRRSMRVQILSTSVPFLRKLQRNSSFLISVFVMTWSFHSRLILF